MMSITLECRKTKSEMEIGYSNFFFLRAKVAELFDKNVWQQYIKIMEIPYGDDQKIFCSSRIVLGKSLKAPV